MDTRALIEHHAGELGFTAVRFATVDRTPFADAFDRWLAAGHHADMAWMLPSRDTRVDPRVRLPTARTAVALAIAHHHRRPPDPGGRTGAVARYAWGRDYHNLVARRLRKLQRALREAGLAAWGAVDTAPIIERAWAHAAGLAHIGKNNIAFLPGKTSYILLAVVFTDAPITPDPPFLRDHCGSCTRCLDACPTSAFVGPRVLDARRCIAYWTIESRTIAPRALRADFGRWIFGCDDCQTPCPHNHDPDDPDEDAFLPRHAWLDAEALLATPDDAFRERFLGTPLMRAGPIGLKRNAAIVLANLGDDRVVPTLTQHGLTHPSAVVRASAVWSLRRLGASFPRADEDPLVQDEIDAPHA